MAKPRKKKLSADSSKKRKTKSQIRRSEAARKGWQTRRINRLADAKAALKAAKKKKKTAVKAPSKKKKIPRVAQLEKEIARLRKEIAERWVPSSEDRDLNKEGTIARHPSDARHKSYTPFVYEELRQAKTVGPLFLAATVKYWAEFLGVSIQDLYTLLMSP